ncbi:MAG TPA: hypothetical protein VMV10_02165 [Pirellulales bacterium]|nr:hypothetical protein [Pirellulales bacterium]
MFVQRAPDPVRQAWQMHLMGDYDPAVFLLPAQPEPIHPENYPAMALLPYPRPERQAWQFPIMASTDYTSLLAGEAAHPETTRQANQDLPRRDFPRQYQPPMEAIDPGALSSREEPNAAILPGMSQPRLPLATGRVPPLSGELAGETIDLSQAVPSDYEPPLAQPAYRRGGVRQPAVEATSYVWATPGDPALYPDRMAMQTPQRHLSASADSRSPSRRSY